jgi:hypothetical protein
MIALHCYSAVQPFAQIQGRFALCFVHINTIVLKGERKSSQTAYAFQNPPAVSYPQPKAANACQ